MSKKLEFDKKEDLVKVAGILPEFKPCAVKHFTEKGKKVFYFDYSVFDEKKGKLIRRIRRICTGGTKANAVKTATSTMKRVDELLKKGFHLPDLSAFDRQPVVDAINYYLFHKLQNTNSQKDYKTIIQKFLLPYAQEHWAELTIVDIGKGKMKQFLDTMTLEHSWQPQTRNNKKHLISDMFEYFKELEVISYNPCKELRSVYKRAAPRIIR